MKKHCNIYTGEQIVFGKQLGHVDLTQPVTYMLDEKNHLIIQDGNHRAFLAWQNGTWDSLPKTCIGTIRGDVSNNPNYRTIDELKISEGDLPSVYKR